LTGLKRVKGYGFIDLKPALSNAQIDAKFLREFKISPKKGIKYFFKEHVASTSHKCLSGLIWYRT